MATYWTLHKQCATCAYWNGPRQLQSDPRVVRCPDNYDQAKGMCQGTQFPAQRGKMVHASLHAGNCWICASGLKET